MSLKNRDPSVVCRPRDSNDACLILLLLCALVRLRPAAPDLERFLYQVGAKNHTNAMVVQAFKGHHPPQPPYADSRLPASVGLVLHVSIFSSCRVSSKVPSFYALPSAYPWDSLGKLLPLPSWST